MKVRVDLHKKEIMVLMICVSVVDGSKVSLKQRKKLSKVNIDKLYIKLANILFENTFPGNLK